MERPSLALRFTRPASRAEITAVGIAPSAAVAYAVFPGAQPDTPWIDTFDLATQRGCSKIIGPVAAFSPTAHASPLRVRSSPPGTSTSSSSSSSSSLFPRIATLSGTSLMVRDFASGRTMLELKDVAAPIAWSADGRALAAAEPRHRIGMWDARTGVRLGRVPGHIDAVTHAAFTPDAKLVTLARDGTLRVTDPASSKTLYKLEIEAPAAAARNPRALAVSPDGNTVVSVWGTVVHIWMPQHGRLTSYNLSSTRACEGWPLCISPDCRYMACWTEAGFDIMDVASGAVVCTREGGPLVTAADFSADAGILVLGRISGDVEVYDVVSDK